MERKLSCNFFGHLRDEETACVSVTGCPGDDMFFTINSKNSGSRNMFILHNDGTVEAVESAFKVNRNYFQHEYLVKCVKFPLPDIFGGSYRNRFWPSSSPSFKIFSFSKNYL